MVAIFPFFGMDYQFMFESNLTSQQDHLGAAGQKAT